MEDLKQIKAVLLSLGIQVEQINIDEKTKTLSLELSHNTVKVLRKYTLEELRSGLVTDARTAPAAPPGQKHKLLGYVSRLLTR